MNLPPIGEETFLICMALAIVLGALLGFALGYGLKEKRHGEEIASIIRITKRIHEATRERAPKGPMSATVKMADGRKYEVPLPLRPC